VSQDHFRRRSSAAVRRVGRRPATAGGRPIPEPREAILMIALAALAGCGDDVRARPDAGPLADLDAGACEPVFGEPALGLQLVASGLAHPVGITAPPGDPRLFIVEQTSGRIRVIAPGDVLLDAPFLDISDDTAGGYEQGLLTIAFHPRYADNGRFFLSYARGGDDALVVEEWLVDPTDPDHADRGSRRVILEVPHSKPYHYGSMLAFGADGLLYVSVGDGGPQLDPEEHGQDLTSLRGKLLRIDVDHRGAGEGYAIPDDNPFADDADRRGEIWAYGLRNPWRFTIDPDSQHIFIGDVGFDSAEEIDVIPAHTPGLDFGWSVLEGAECLDPGDCDTTGLVPPTYVYSHADGCAIVGGPVYRGCRMPGHRGKLFFGDFCDGWVRSLIYSNGTAGFLTDYPGLQIANVSAIGTDAAGELYLADFDAGEVSRVVPVD